MFQPPQHIVEQGKPILRARLRPVSTWTKVFREECPPGCRPHVQVRLANGMTYIGQVGHFTADLETADREIVLVTPKNVNVSATSQNVFIHTGGGDDAIGVRPGRRRLISGPCRRRRART